MHPVLLQLGPLTIHSYGVMLALLVYGSSQTHASVVPWLPGLKWGSPER